MKQAHHRDSILSGLLVSGDKPVKYSRQREAVLSAILDCCDHPTADTIYEIVRQKSPQISLGTVYRNLNQLVDLGVLRKIPMPSGSDRFDCKMSPHDHLICRRCGRVIDLEIARMQNLDEDIMSACGFEITDHHLILEGFCAECRQHP